jgi:hypothetical protein
LRGISNALAKLPPEVVFAAFMVGAAGFFGKLYGLPFNLPSLDVAEALGIHYLLPLVGVALCGACVVAGGGRAGARLLCIALPCYGLVLLVHFNLKLWAPHINPVLYDGLYWKMDQQVHWLVALCMAARRAMGTIMPLDGTFYLQGFILLFYVAFCYHAFRTPHKLRQLTMSVMLLQGLGGLSYLAFPALGPFLYEQGLNPTLSEFQRDMLDFYQQSVTYGPGWLALHGSNGLVKGLAAMPSLHAGGTFLFFLFAWKHAPRLVPVYLPLVVYIFVAAVSTRWHYLIDLPVGLALAFVCVKLAEWLLPNDPEPQHIAA